MRFTVRISRVASGDVVADGYTIHAIVDAAGKPKRPPVWLTERLAAPVRRTVVSAPMTAMPSKVFGSAQVIESLPEPPL